MMEDANKKLGQKKAITIALCIPCMNRLQILKKTLLRNLEESLQFSNVSVQLLDYNSNDGLDKWVKNETTDFIKLGKLVYYKLINPKPIYFSHPHSRNILFRLANSSVLCNMNADYLITRDFLSHISKKFIGQNRLALIANINKVDKDNFGRLCVLNSDFINVGGYDELFEGYGYEDTDLCLRLGMSGVNLESIDKHYCSDFIDHSDQLRIENMFDYHNVNKILIKKNSPIETEICFLFRDNKVEFGELLKSETDIPRLINGVWQTGLIVTHTGEEFTIRFSNRNDLSERRFIREKKGYVVENENGIFYEVVSRSVRNKILFLKSQITNSEYLKRRQKTGQWKVNKDGFGKGLVLRNFEEMIDLNHF